MSWTKIQIPEQPTPTLVLVKDIAPSSSEKTVKDFFIFCGKLKAFELVKDESTGKQIALVWFEREPAAKTATLLSNALIDDSHITVEPYFKDAIFSDEHHDDGQEAKPKSRIIAEYLAAGYELQDHVIAKGIEYDQKYNLSDKVKAYLAQLQETVKNLDSKYKVSETVSAKAGEIDSNYHIQDKVKQVQQHPVAQKVHDIAASTYSQILAVHEQAKIIAAEKKAASIAAASTPAETAH